MTTNHRTHAASFSAITGVMLALAGTANAATAPAAAPLPAAPPPAAVLRVVMIDRNLILQRSSAGKDIIAQTQNFSKQAEAQFRGEQTQLQADATSLQQQLAILAPDVRDQKEKEFAVKEQSLQNRVQQRQADIQAGFAKATQQLETALEPILVEIMRERGATMVLDRAAVVMAGNDVDVSPAAIQQLDKKLPHLKVDLVPNSGAVPGLAPAASAARAPAAPAGK